MARIAVAATAPFGADVLERLAARHEVTALLTRPDAPSGRGRRSRRRRRSSTAERLGIPRPPARASGARARARRATRRRLRLRAADPRGAPRGGLWLNVHPSLLPRWRGAAPVERAIMAGDTETGVTIHRTVKELDAGPVAAQQAFPIGPTTTRARYSRTPPRLPRTSSTRFSRSRCRLRPTGRGGRHLRGEDRACRPRARPRPARRGARPPGASVAPHIGARAELHGRRVTVWRARVGEEDASS